MKAKSPSAKEAKFALRFAIQHLSRRQKIHFPLVHQARLNEIVSDLPDTGMNLLTSDDPDAASSTMATGNAEIITKESSFAIRFAFAALRLIAGLLITVGLALPLVWIATL
jgi:hypothetical protein